MGYEATGVTQEMVEAFKQAKNCQCHPGDEVGVRIQAALDASTDLQALERFAHAAARHATTDGVDEWNNLVEVWDSLPDSLRKNLLP